MIDILVLGGGAWGGALALQAARAGAATALWLRDPAQAEVLRTTRVHPRFPGRVFPNSIAITTEIMTPARLRLLAVPAQSLRSVSERLGDTGPIVVCAKGIEEGSGALVLEILAESCPGVATAILSGPNFAHEIAAGLPAAAVIGSSDPDLRGLAMRMLGTPGFRVYGNDDPVGVQIGGAAKNVIAIAAGAVSGRGLGENARAGLVTRGLAEIARFAVAAGGRADTVAGLSGMGDLLLTCTGLASRNYRLGDALGRGKSLAEAMADSTGVAEGVTTATALCTRAARMGLELPICDVVAALVSSRTTLDDAIAALLARPMRDE